MKPESPRDLEFHWHGEAVTVLCPDLPYRSLRYEVQHKSIFDEEWQVSAVASSQGRVTGHPQEATSRNTLREREREREREKHPSVAFICI